MTATKDLEGLASDLSFLLEAARQAGAYAAEAAGTRGRSMHCRTRHGIREEVGWAEEESFSLRVLAEVKSDSAQKATQEATGTTAKTTTGTALAEAVATCSLPPTKDTATRAALRKETLGKLAARASEMARLAPPDPWLGLATSDELTSHPKPPSLGADDLELHETADPPTATDLAQDCAALEAASRAVKGVTAIAEAEAHWGASESLLLASNGISDTRRGTLSGRVVAAVAGSGTEMQVDWHGHSARWREDLESCEELGTEAGRRVVAKQNPILPPAGGRATVVFEPRVAAVFLAALAAAANGEALLRGTSFLCGHEQETLLPQGLRLVDEPLRPRGHSARTQDAEGLACADLTLYENGSFVRPFLDLARARQMGVASTANARGAGTSKSCGASNLCLRGGAVSVEELHNQASATGEVAIFVTDLLGHGLNSITGDWSQGFQGFLIEQGTATRAISGATLAGNLRDFLPQMLVGDDLKLRTGHDVPSLLIPHLALGVASPVASPTTEPTAQA